MSGMPESAGSLPSTPVVSHLAAAWSTSIAALADVGVEVVGVVALIDAAAVGVVAAGDQRWMYRQGYSIVLA